MSTRSDLVGRSLFFVLVDTFFSKHMLSLGFDPLSSIVAAVDEGDLLPLALTCTTLRDVCNLRSDQTRDPNGPRWYTHGTSRLTWAVEVMGATPNEEWCSYAAKHGHLDFFKCLRELDMIKINTDFLQWTRQDVRPCPWYIICINAAEGGHLHILQWARQNGCPWDMNTCAEAALGGHLAILQWARENGYPWSIKICANAALGGHLAILQWARENGCPWDSCTCAYAALGGHLDILQWVRQNGCPWDRTTCLYLARNDETRHWIQSQP